jgi:hypothetical protein
VPANPQSSPYGSRLRRVLGPPKSARTATAIAATAIIATLIVLLTFLALPRTAATTSSPLRWLVKSNDLALLQRQAAIDGATLPVFTWVGCGGESDPDRCQAGQQPIYTSYWALRDTAKTGWHGTAVFDIETWSDTPATQRADPDTWICKAAELQRTDPYLKVIITPYAKPPTTKMIPEDLEAAKCGAYAVDVQTQFANGHPGEFRSFIREAVKAIRKVDKKIIILAGLATNNPYVKTSGNLVTDYHEAVAAGVQGFWLNANNWLSRNRCTSAQGGPGCPQTGIQFLADIGLMTGSPASPPG